MAATMDSAIPELMPLDGLFVEIIGLPKPEPEEDSYDLNGEQGRVVGWADEQDKYVVQLFSGYQVYVEAENLVEFQPPDPEMRGGFDVAWPWAPSAQGIFASMVNKHVSEKGYCVVQMFQADQEDSQWMSKELNWGLLKQEVEEEYLGQDVVDGKVAWLQYEALDEDSPPLNLMSYSLERDLHPDMRMEYLLGLDRCDKAMTNLAALMWPLTPFWEDDRAFQAWGRSSGMVRAGFEEGSPEGLRGNTLWGPDEMAEEDRHLKFLNTRKLCMIYLVDNEGGDLVLTPNDEAYEYNDARIPLSKNKLVIFRCDAMGHSYTYAPEGRNLSLTAWVLDMPHSEKTDEEKLRVLDGPEEPMGTRTNVMALHPRYPGNVYCKEAFWNVFAGGCDTETRVPIVRWDPDLYYRREMQPGFSCTCHGGLMSETDIAMFDNCFFGISEQEAKLMDPYHRLILEVGYETLRAAGHYRQQLKGFDCGVFVGDTGSDWNEMQRPVERGEAAYGTSTRFAACTRLSCIMGLTGPTSTSETACSSSLVACGVAQMTMRRRMRGQKKGSVSAELTHSLVIGSNLLLGVGGYQGLSGPGMLSPEGRCFTFDVSADGYARGEGVGGVKLKVCHDSGDSMNRLAVLAGCAVNQDGRSATLTAPNGPAQQEVIRQSFREGGLLPTMSTVAECHGTGTPLGDPIEVGALQAVMKIDRGSKPMLKTSAKTNLGHLEAGAGIAGFIKCICMLESSSCMPNLHLGKMNPHLDVDGYPVYFTTEPTDYGTNSGVNGVSSFGFGGTNARADLWGHAQNGHRQCITGLVPRARSIIV